MNRRETRAWWRRRLRGESTHEISRAQAARTTPSRVPAAVSVRIEELHLQSFTHREGRHVADALRHGLSSLLAGESVPDSWLQGHTVEKGKLQDVRLRPGAKMQVVGEQLARALLRAEEGLERR